MERVRFEQLGPVVVSDPNRTDVACFVGFIAPRDVAVPEPIERWLGEQGWLPTPVYGNQLDERGPFARDSARALRDVPVPIDTWDAFEQLFESDRRDPDSPLSLGSSLAAAVRSFFAEGGRKCYVVPVGDFASSLAWHQVAVATEFQSDFFFEDFSASRDPRLGEGWIEPDAPGERRFARRDGALRVFTGDGQGIALIERRPVAGDYAVAATLSSANLLAEGGVVARYQDEDNYYFATLTPAGGDAAAVIGRRQGGVDTVLDRRSIRERRGVPLELLLSLNGPALELRVDGDLVATADDTALPSSGRAGLIGRPTASVASRRTALLSLLLPGFGAGPAVTASDPSSWHGFAHVLGLPDVSFVCMPDLPEIVARPPEPLETARRPAAAVTHFVPCAVEHLPAPDTGQVRGQAPRCDAQGFAEWATALQAATSLLVREAREIQLVASIPIPEPGSEPARSLPRYLERHLGLGLDADVSAGALPEPGVAPVGLASSFLQLVYPWVRSGSGRDLAEGLEAPEGPLIGLLARNALQHGTFRSAAGTPIDVLEIVPTLSREERMTQIGRYAFEDRVTLFGPTPRGLQLLSDVTTSGSDGYRQAALGRMIALVVRAARTVGEDLVFESSGENLWSRVQSRLDEVLLRLLAAGALRGNARSAFQVRCDRSTMSQNDLDAGRVIAMVQLQAALPIDRITVALALEDGGRIALLGRGVSSEEAA